uniref:Uncharacterized protein n=1 Tax=Megaselia scalaris TaxID=36166 RepID=T1H3A0_MEGSC
MITSDSKTEYKFSRARPTRTSLQARNFTETVCPSTHLRCISGKCITVEQICDRTVDCPDGSDEFNCDYSQYNTNVSTTKSSNTKIDRKIKS